VVELECGIVAAVAAMFTFLSFQANQLQLAFSTTALLCFIRLKSVVRIRVLAEA
jgi:hypothetical protein